MSAVAAGALVLYKGQPALVKQIGRKIDIELAGGQVVSVRTKDFALLHPGPLRSLNDVTEIEGEPLVAWELLQGQMVNLETLCDLAFGQFTPSSAWEAWLLVDDGLLFQGTPEAIQATDAGTRNALHARREARAAEEAAWAAFKTRAESRTLLAEDGRYLDEVEAVALGQSERSRVLDLLGRSQTPEAAHAFLLNVGYWDEFVNPYPSRAGAPVTLPGSVLPDLPDEYRLDLTDMVALAIDDEGNHDPDDAISLVDDWLWVHVADVAALVAADSPADLEARSRAANLYLPEGTVPMLPVPATTQLGLGLHEVSPALSFGMKLDAQGEISDLRIAPSLVKVRRMSYDEAQAQIDSEPLASLAALSDRLRERRLARGAIEIDLPEVRVRVGEQGRVVITPLPAHRSRDLVREAMLLAGEAAGSYAIANNIPLPFTAQEAPVAYEPSELLAGPAGMFAVRRTMQRSRQQTSPAPHAGLGLEVYVQATSPLRRYLDLVVHQQLRAHLQGAEPLSQSDILLRVGSVEEPAAAVRQAERLSIGHWTCVYLLQNPSWQGQGVVADERNGQYTLIIPELGIETHQRLKGSTPMNALVDLELTGVDLPQREATFRVQRSVH